MLQRLGAAPGRKNLLRHLIGLSEEFATSNVSASSGRTLLASSGNGFIWASLAHIHGIPGIPDWADWFAGELKTHRATMPALGIGCDPVIVKGQKEQFLDWLSWGIESEGVRFPNPTRSSPLAMYQPEEYFPDRALSEVRYYPGGGAAVRQLDSSVSLLFAPAPLRR